MIVVDASLAVKWVIDETGSPAALKLLIREWGTVTGPDLLGIEVASAVSRRANSGEITASDALLAMNKWTRLVDSAAIRLHRTSSPGLLAAVQLSTELRHPLKDCIYLALAIELECPLATCDAKFVARAVGLYPEVRMLQDF